MLETDRTLEIFKRFFEKNPSPKGDLYYINHFTLLVAVVLSAQTTDAGVNRVTTTLFKTIQTPEDIIHLGENELRDKIKAIGLYRAKSRYIVRLSHVIKERFNGQVPQTLEHLMDLPGVGRKTANVILNTLFDQPTIAVDTHVFRVAHRLDLAKSLTTLGVEEELTACIPKTHLKEAHLWLVLHGRHICKARKPLCFQCFLTDLCPFFKNKVK